MSGPTRFLLSGLATVAVIGLAIIVYGVTH